MEITLLRTFLEVSTTGSFVSASERLFVTPSAVSLRIQRLEGDLGRPLFTRSKAGADLTSAGRQFERFALGHIKLWEEAKQQVAIPVGYTQSLVVGAEHSLWPRLGFRWIDQIRQQMPDLSIRSEIGMPDRLTRFMIEGIIQSALVYTPQLRPGLMTAKVMDEELVMVASWKSPNIDQIREHYLFVDWGPEFVQAHAIHLPDLVHSGLTFALGAMSIDYMLKRRVAAYIPARSAAEHIVSGQLHLVPDTPRFPYPIYNVWRDDLDEKVIEAARSALVTILKGVEAMQSDVIEQLAKISDEDSVAVLGETSL